MADIKSKLIVIPFLIVLSGILLLNLIMKDQTISVSENRALSQMPTIKDLINGTYAEKFENYFSDQFVLRDEFKKFYSRTQLALGSNKINDYYYLLANDWIMPSPFKIIPDAEIKDMANIVNELTDIAIGSNKEVFYVSTPHKDSMLTHLFPKYTEGLSNSMINEINLEKHFDKDKIKIINIDEYLLSSFTPKEREKLYFKTDHHWNGIGAFEGFKYIIGKLNLPGIKPDWNNYIVTEYDKGMFLGSYNNSIGNLVKIDESIPYVRLKKEPDYAFFRFDGTQDFKAKSENYVATQRNKKVISYGGAYMLSASYHILKIKNQNALSDKKILIFADSYQPPTSLLFSDIFSEVQLVDPRYIDKLNMTVDDIIRKSNADILMFMYNNRGFTDMMTAMEKHR